MAKTKQTRKTILTTIEKLIGAETAEVKLDVSQFGRQSSTMREYLKAEGLHETETVQPYIVG